MVPLPVCSTNRPLNVHINIPLVYSGRWTGETWTSRKDRRHKCIWCNVWREPHGPNACGSRERRCSVLTGRINTHLLRVSSRAHDCWLQLIISNSRPFLTFAKGELWRYLLHKDQVGITGLSYLSHKPHILREVIVPYTPTVEACADTNITSGQPPPQSCFKVTWPRRTRQ